MIGKLFLATIISNYYLIVKMSMTVITIMTITTMIMIMDDKIKSNKNRNHNTIINSNNNSTKNNKQITTHTTNEITSTISMNMNFKNTTPLTILKATRNRSHTSSEMTKKFICPWLNLDFESYKVPGLASSEHQGRVKDKQQMSPWLSYDYRLLMSFCQRRARYK